MGATAVVFAVRAVGVNVGTVEALSRRVEEMVGLTKDARFIIVAVETVRNGRAAKATVR